MAIFISWSGERTKVIAHAFRELLRYTLHTKQMFFSDANLSKGKLWFEQLKVSLGDSTFCVVIATPESLSSSWVMFEAGAIWRATNGTNVTALMVGMDSAKLARSPLSQFQNTKCEKEDVLNLIRDIHAFLGSPADEDVVASAFQHAWPQFEKVVVGIAFEEVGEGKVASKEGGAPDLVRRIGELESYMVDREKRLLATMKSVVRETRNEVAGAIIGQGPFATASVADAQNLLYPTSPSMASRISTEPFWSVTDPASFSGLAAIPSFTSSMAPISAGMSPLFGSSLDEVDPNPSGQQASKPFTRRRKRKPKSK